MPDLRITTENLSKRFNREWIFRKFSYEFKPGQVYAITGPNGSGKSTLLQTLAGAIPQTGGTLSYQDSNGTVPIEKIYRHITFAAPYVDLIEEFTLKEHIEFHFSMRTPRTGRNVKDIIQLLYLERSAEKHVGEFSSGMKQRLKLGLAMFTETDILLLDEPGSNLDANAFDWYYKHLTSLPRETTVIIASNDPEEYPAHSQILNITSYK